MIIYDEKMLKIKGINKQVKTMMGQYDLLIQKLIDGTIRHIETLELDSLRATIPEAVNAIEAELANINYNPRITEYFENIN